MTSNPEGGGGRDTAADRALRGLTNIVVPPEPGERVRARSDRLTPRLSAFTDDVWARSRLRRLRLAMGAVAAVILVGSLCLLAWTVRRTDDIAARQPLAAAVVRTREGAVGIRHAASPSQGFVAAPAPYRREVGAEDRILTKEGHAEVTLASGALVELGPATELELGAGERSPGALSERIQLVAGRISVRVPKLPAGSRLVVTTPHSAVTVHGTAFIVEVQRASEIAESFTTVSVTEGRVSVERAGREVFLGPGTEWSSLGRRPDPVGAGPPAARGSTLPQETFLLRSAMRKRRDGDPKHALDLIGRLLSAYPASPLAPEARVERARALTDLEAKHVP